MLLTLLLATALTSHLAVQGAEWRTSGGHFCTQRCRETEREGIVAYNCPAVDSITLEYHPRWSSNSGRPDSGGISEDDQYFWDYCTPAKQESIESDENGSHTMKPVTLPQSINNGGWGSGSGGSDFNSGHNSHVASSLPGVDCRGECRESRDKFKCEVSSQQVDTFYCSPESLLHRQQISSRLKLWCTGPCEKRASQYQCPTMMGFDLCSPAVGKTSDNRDCHSACREEEEAEKHYKCFTNHDMTVKHHCGNWNISELSNSALEYDDQNRICAGPCEDREGEMICNVMEWVWDEESKISKLETRLGYCGGGPSNMARNIGIILGCLAAAVLIIVIVAVVMCKNKGYFRTSTSEN